MEDFKKIQTICDSITSPSASIEIRSVPINDANLQHTNYKQFSARKLPKISNLKLDLGIDNFPSYTPQPDNLTARSNAVREKFHIKHSPSTTRSQRRISKGMVKKDKISETIKRIQTAQQTQKPTSASLNRINFAKECIPPPPTIKEEDRVPIADLMVLDSVRQQNRNLAPTREAGRRAVLSRPGLLGYVDLLSAFESISKTFVESNWFTNQGKLEVVDNILYLEKMYIKLAKYAGSRYDSYKVREDELSAEVEKLRSELEDYRLLDSKYKEKCSILSTIKKRQKDKEADYKYQERIMTKEHARLEDEIDKQAQRIDFMTKNGDVEQLSRELEQTKRRLREVEYQNSIAIEKKSNQIYTLTHKLGVKKDKLEKIKSYVQNLEGDKLNHDEQIGNREDHIARIIEQSKEYLENCHMYREEFARYYTMKEKYDLLQIQYGKLKRKYNKAEMNILLGNTGLGGNHSVNMEDPIFAKFTKNAAEKTNPVFTEDTMGKLLTENTELRYKFEGVNLSLYQYRRPGFASFIQHELPDSSTAEFTPPYNQWLIITLRGILDSKYYEHLICSEDMGRNPTRFPEFVYSWLGQYEVDEASRQVKDVEHKIEEKGNKARVDLLMALEQEKVRNMWEIFTFREFLMEDMAIDELGFYLHCRFLLFRGPQLSHSAGRYSMAHFVPLSRVHEVCDAVMDKIDEQERNDFKNLLKNKTKDRKNIPHLESSLALRLLLEYYKREKKCKFLALNQLFSLCPDKTYSFSSFKTICKNLNEDTTDLAIATMYRDIWTIGLGQITPEAFFTYANESLYLFNCLRLKGAWDPPPTTYRGEINPNAGKYGEVMHAVYSAWKDNKEIEDIKSLVTKMGIPDIPKQIQSLEQIIQRKGQKIPLNYLGRNLNDIYKHLWALISVLQLSYEEHNAFNKIGNVLHPKSQLGVKLDLNDIKNASGLLAANAHAQKVQDFIARNAVVRIQRRWKERINKKIGVSVKVAMGVTRFKRSVSKKETSQNLKQK